MRPLWRPLRASGRPRLLHPHFLRSKGGRAGEAAVEIRGSLHEASSAFGRSATPFSRYVFPVFYSGAHAGPPLISRAFSRRRFSSRSFLTDCFVPPSRACLPRTVSMLSPLSPSSRTHHELSLLSSLSSLRDDRVTTLRGDTPPPVWGLGGAGPPRFPHGSSFLASTRHFSQTTGGSDQDGRRTTVSPLSPPSSSSSFSSTPSSSSASSSPSASSPSPSSSSTASVSQADPSVSASASFSPRSEGRSRPSLSSWRPGSDRTNGAGLFARWCSAGALLRLLEKVVRGLCSALVKYTKVVFKYLKLFVTNPMVVKKWYKKGKESAVHTWKWTVTGFSLFYANVRVSYQLLKKKIRGHPLRYNEHKLLVRTTADALKLIPFSLMIIIPLGELLLPVVLRLFPNMLPSTFFEKQVDNAYLSRKLKAKQELAAFFQELVREHTKHIIEHESNDALKDKAKTLKEFQEKLLQKDRQDVNPFLSVKEILSFARLFKEEFVLEKLDLQTLQVMCKLLGIQPYGLRSHVVLQLRYHLNHIHREDREFMWEGVETLSHDELVEACKDRAMMFHNISDDDMRQEMRQWLAISSHKDIPPLLLLWCRCISLTHSPIPPPVDLATAPPPGVGTPQPVSEDAAASAAAAAVTEAHAAESARGASKPEKAQDLAGGSAEPAAAGGAQELATEGVCTPGAAADSTERREEDEAEDEQYRRQSATLEAMERQVQLLRAEEESLRQSVQMLEAQRQRAAAKDSREGMGNDEEADAGSSLQSAMTTGESREELVSPVGDAAVPETAKPAEHRERERERGGGKTQTESAKEALAKRREAPEGDEKGELFQDTGVSETKEVAAKEGEASSRDGSASEKAFVDELSSVQRGREMLQRRSRRMELELRLLRRLADMQHAHQEEAFGALTRLLELAHSYRLKQELAASAKAEGENIACAPEAKTPGPPPGDASLLSLSENEKLKEHEEAERRHHELRRAADRENGVQIRNDFIVAVQAFERQIQEVIESFASGVQQVDALMRDAKTLQMDEGDPLFYPEDHSDLEDSSDIRSFVRPQFVPLSTSRLCGPTPPKDSGAGLACEKDLSLDKESPGVEGATQVKEAAK
ncbi:UNVERIFIED_CONTAM: LETM1 family protein [Hammondia hammondi]|eukprot:XP_008889032.1 LETM1 family protein [Hammondia hammondi]